MSPPPSVKRWKSNYDGQWHAFPAEQADDESRTFLQALCEHSVPLNQVERIPPPDVAALCRACEGVISELASESDPHDLWRGL